MEIRLKIEQWDDIKQHYEHGCLLLGNGASIAMHTGFMYSSLRAAAQERGFLEEAGQVFDVFETGDFELVLRLVWQADLVNTALKAKAPDVRKAYESVRSALIRTVRATHLAHSEVSDSPLTKAQNSYLLTKHAFLSSFQLVVSLNYDLLVYWARMAAWGAGHDNTRDCFGKEDDGRLVFQGLPERLERGMSFIVYPHGNLCMARSRYGDEVKLRGGDARLLEATLQAWESGEFGPLFVSEGTFEQKMRSIRSSAYLSASYAGMRKQTERNTLVLFGWGMGEQDKHIVDALQSRNPARVAVSVHQRTDREIEELVFRTRQTFGVDPDIFAAQSAGPWARRSAEIKAGSDGA
jgi:hypothetical protein